MQLRTKVSTQLCVSDYCDAAISESFLDSRGGADAAVTTKQSKYAGTSAATAAACTSAALCTWALESPLSGHVDYSDAQQTSRTNRLAAIGANNLLFTSGHWNYVTLPYIRVYGGVEESGAFRETAKAQCGLGLQGVDDARRHVFRATEDQTGQDKMDCDTEHEAGFVRVETRSTRGIEKAPDFANVLKG